MPPRDVPIWVGARGPQLVRTAARLADGLFLSGCSPEQHDRIIAEASTAGGTRYALYQTATERPAAESERSWDGAAELLASEVARLRPASIGLNLVDLASASDGRPRDPVPLVIRAAELLNAIDG
jgi:alkanesulfonate monooxygenase SsuD/methylene tetrahydromethanopterin reductase-like flavin-dependent oxidoreductase (luciferase family)